MPCHPRAITYCLSSNKSTPVYHHNFWIPKYGRPGLNRKWTPETSNSAILRYAKTTVTLECTKDPSSGVAFRLVSRGPSVPPVTILNDFEMYASKGFLISWWLTDSSLHPFRVNLSFCSLLQMSYGKGFGSRRHTKCFRVKLYIGTQMS